MGSTISIVLSMLPATPVHDNTSPRTSMPACTSRSGEQTAHVPPSGWIRAVGCCVARGSKICTVFQPCSAALPNSKKNPILHKTYLKVLVQIFFDCSLVDLFINLCVIICDKI